MGIKIPPPVVEKDIFTIGKMNNNIPLVSIITPSYNQGRYIEETIKSVLSQDYPKIEYIVVDGGSTDNTIEILKRYDRIKWISEPDKGQADAINKGFKMARGDILAWLNSDDTYRIGVVKKVVDFFIENPDVAMVYGDGYEINEDGYIIKRFPDTQSFDLWKLINIWDYILQPTVFIRRDALFKVGLLNTSLRWCLDWDLWIRLASKFKIRYLPLEIANSRVYSSTKTSTGGLERLKEIIKVMRRYSKRRYPPGLFIYGEDTIENLIMARYPILYRFLLRLPLKFLRYKFGKMPHESQGFYGDGWVTRVSYFTLPSYEGNVLILEGYFPDYLPNVKRLLPLNVKITVNGGEKFIRTIYQPGDFRVECDLESCYKYTLLEIKIESGMTFIPKDLGLGSDPRRLSFMIKKLYLEYRN
ncbi:MAG: hypothetical protein Fur0020_12090 [Thermodesulfovibrionia bacterium]